MRILVVLAFLAMPVSADLQLNYSGFYGRMKKLQQPEYSDITLAFALIEQQSGQRCRYTDIRLQSQEHDMRIDMAANDELSLPYDESIKNSNAILHVMQADNMPACQIQFRIRSRMRLPLELSLEQLQHYQQQFDLLLDDMAGLGKYWLPDVTGVILQFANDAVVADYSAGAAKNTHCQQARCNIELHNLTDEPYQWRFDQRPLYILPLIGETAH